MIAAVVLAAGAGERLGGIAKALLEFKGESFAALIARTAREAGVGELTIVLGPPHEDQIAPHALEHGYRVVRNPNPTRGMASSVGLGFSSGLSGEAAFLWPVDVPCVKVGTITAMIANGGRDRFVVPVHGGRGGHPVLIGAELFAQLAACGDAVAGARTVLRHNEQRAVRLTVDDPFVLRDVDEPSQLRSLGDG